MKRPLTTAQPPGVLLLAWAMLCVTGCWEERIVYDGWADFARQFGDRRTMGPPGQPVHSTAPAQRFNGYSILIESFSGVDRYRRASDLMRRLAEKAGVEGLWLQETGDDLHVYRGRFDSMASAEALAALEHTRRVQFDELRPYKDAELVAVGESGQPQRTQTLDLKHFSGYYTLQIGYYDSDYGEDYQPAAEKAAKALREEGVKAFYYHGPHRSMVTVELFTDADFEQDGPVRVYGPRIEQWRRQYPHNLGNGRTVVESFKVGDGDKREQRNQPSMLVRVP